MEDSAKPPFLAIAVVLDAGARAAAVTRSHADAYERATLAANGSDVSGVDLIELTINPTSFLALRKIFQLGEDTVGL